MAIMILKTKSSFEFSSVTNFMILLLAVLHCLGWVISDPTEGFTPVALTNSSFVIQKPYDVAVDQRYSFVDGVRKLWVYSTDKPHSPNSKTSPRTEIRISGYDYSSGVWQFEGHVFVPNGTTGVCIMQVFGGSSHATTLMLLVIDGALHYYRRQVLVPNFYDKWFRLNVIHDVDGGMVTVFIDGDMKLEVNDQGGRSHFFKCGVYANTYDSHYMESRWKGIMVLRK